MGNERSRWAMIWKPEGDEQNIPLAVRARFAMSGANRLHAVTEENHPELMAIVRQVSESAKIPAPQVYMWESRKPVANALAMPTSVPTIAFSKPITELLNGEELGAVTAHELGHVKNMSQIGKLYWLSAIGGFAAGHVLSRPLENALVSQSRKTGNPGLAHTGKIISEVMRVGGGMAAGAAASRAEESAADRYAAFISGSAVPLLSALQKLGEFHQGEKTGKRSFLKRLLNTHPDFDKRRDALGVTQEELAAYRAAQQDVPVPVTVRETQASADEMPPSPAPETAWQARIAAQQALAESEPVLRR